MIITLLKVLFGWIFVVVNVGEKKCLNSELWHACAGPLVSLPSVGTRVVYFPQGHSEQVDRTCYPFSLLVSWLFCS